MPMYVELLDYAGATMQSAVALALSPPKTNPVSSEARAGKYLVFHLGREHFGIRVLKVREIMGLQDITAVPHTPVLRQGSV